MMTSTLRGVQMELVRMLADNLSAAQAEEIGLALARLRMIEESMAEEARGDIGQHADVSGRAIGMIHT